MEQMDLSRLAGRVAVVTGAGGGLGSAVSEELVLSGLKVVAVDADADKLHALEARLRVVGEAGAPESGSPDSVGTLHAMRADITREADLQRAFQWVENHLGGVAVVINNAGVAPMKALQDSDNELMASTLNVNVLGLAAVTREAINSMQKHGISDGHVINIGSTVGHAESVTRSLLEMFAMPMYIASKHAVIGFNRALRGHLKAQGVTVRVTDLSPGTIQTPLVSEDALRAMENRVMQPRDVARAVRFVLSTPPHVEIVHLTIQPAGEVW